MNPIALKAGAFAESTCSCKKCAAMCERTPCWPTPDEAQALIAAGFGDRLMTDWWYASPRNVRMLVPATVGHEGTLAPRVSRLLGENKGPCSFLTADKKCELHSLGLKPLEGRVAIHATSYRDFEVQDEISDAVREHIVGLWRNEQDKFQFHGDPE